MIGFNVAQLLKSSVGTVRRVEVDDSDPELSAELHIVSPTKGELRLMRTNSGVLVTGKLTHLVEDSCSRCLEPFSNLETIELNEEFLPVVDVNSGLPLSETRDPDAFTLNSNHELDLSEAIRQYTILERPLRPLCKPDCKGLCSECGANLNLGPCVHQSATGEPAQGAFGKLLAERLRQAGFKPEEEK